MAVDAQLLRQLLERGDRVLIVKGRLCIEPASGIPVPSEWLRAHSSDLTREILKTTGEDAVFYESFSTGCYGPRMAAGVTLQFRTLYECDAYAIFNVGLTYVRGPRKGKPLPGNQFRVGKRSHFHKFWQRCQLKTPRLSRFADYMGNLEGIAFRASRSNERIDTGTITPITVTAAQVERAFLPHNSRTESAQLSAKARTNASHNDSAQSHTLSGLQPILTAGNSNHGNTVVRECGARGLPTPLDIPPQDQSPDEWLADYESAEYNLGGTLQ